MTTKTIYVPVLIETAEQAESLPVGTLARHSEGAGMDHAHKVSIFGREVWVAVGGNCTNAEMVGWTALVPVEAEEETRVTPEALADAAGRVLARADEAARTYAPPPDRLVIQQETRLVTPWEAA